MPLASHDTNARASDVIWHKSHLACHFNYLDLRNGMVPLTMLSAPHDAVTNTNGITWHKYWWLHMTKKLCCTPFGSLNIRNEVGPLMMLLASCNTDACVNDIKWPKSHVSHHFNCLDLRNAMVLLLMPSASCDADTDVSGITWPKSHVPSQFVHLDLRNVMMPWTTLLTWYQSLCKWCHMTKKTCYILFWSSLCKECSAVIDDIVHITWFWYQCSGTTWHQHQCLWHHVTPVMMPMASHNQNSHVAPHFNYLNLRNAVGPLMMLLASCNIDASANGIGWPVTHIPSHTWL